MADQDLQRVVSRLRQQLKVWEERCNKLIKEKDHCLKDAEDQATRIKELESEVEHLQKVIQQIKLSKEAEIKSLKEQNREIELRLQQLSAEDIHDEVPILAKIASTSTAMSTLEESELKMAAPVPGVSIRSIHGALVGGSWKGIDRLCDTVYQHELETEDDHVMLWQPGTPWAGHPWRYSLKLHISSSPDMEHCVGQFDQDVFPALRCICQDGGCHLTHCFMDCSTQDEPFKEHVDLIHNEAKSSDLAVLFVGRDFSDQVAIALKAILSDKSSCRGVVVCVDQAESIPESYSSHLDELRKKFSSPVHLKIISGFTGDSLEDRCKDLLEALQHMLKHACCVPSMPRVSEDLAVSRIGILQDMKIEQEQTELVQLFTSETDLIGVALCFDALQLYTFGEGSASVPPFMLRSLPGAGKSTLLVRWLSEIAAGNVIILSHFVTFPNSPSSQADVMYRRFIQKLQYHYPDCPSCPTYSYSDNVLKEFFLKSLAHAAAKCLGKANQQQILIVIDNADRMEDCQKSLEWLLKPLPLCVKAVLSLDLTSYPKDWNVFPSVDIPSVNSDDAVDTIVDTFPDQFETFQVSDLLEKGAEETFSRIWCLLAAYYVLFLLNRKEVSSEDRDEALDEIIAEFDNCNDLPSLVEQIFSVLDESLGTKGDALFLILQYICQSTHGLTVQELLEVANVPYFVWAVVFQYLRGLHVLVEAGGMVQFAHPVVKEAVKSAIYFHGNDLGLARSLLAYYKNPEGPPVHISRLLEEMPHHLTLLADKAELKSLLSNVKVLIFMVYSGSYSKLMSLWRSIGMTKEAMIEEYLRYMTSAEARGDGGDTSHIAHLWQQLGVFLRTVQDYQRSEQCLERSLELHEAYFDPDSPEVARSVYELGVLYIAWKRPQTAEGLLQQALGSFEEAFSPDSWECLKVLKALKTVKEVLHQDEMALNLESEIVRAYNAVMTQPQNSSNVKAIRRIFKQLESEVTEVESDGSAVALHELATLHAVMGDLESSTKYYGFALNMRERLLGDSHIDTACTLYNMGQVAALQGRQDVTCVLWEKAFKNLLQIFGVKSYHAMTSDLMEKLFAVYMEQGKYKSAEAVQRFAVGYLEKEFGANHIQFGRAMNNFGIVLAQQNEVSEAKQYMQAALSVFQRLGYDTASIDANLARLSDGQ